MDWDQIRLHVVTGKGGTGKTTVAAALALALASGGQRVLLVEVEGRQGIAQLFDTAPLPYEERKVAVAAAGGDVHALAIEPEAAVLEYLDMYYRLGRAGKALDKMGALEFATTIAPGLRDVLLTGKTYEATRRRAPGGGYAYDAVVLDAPPTGRITRFLNVNDRLADADGTLLEGMMMDGLHPTRKGYAVWAESLKPLLTELLGPPAATDQAPPPTGDPSASS